MDTASIRVSWLLQYMYICTVCFLNFSLCSSVRTYRLWVNRLMRWGDNYTRTRWLLATSHVVISCCGFFKITTYNRCTVSCVWITPRQTRIHLHCPTFVAPCPQMPRCLSNLSLSSFSYPPPHPTASRRPVAKTGFQDTALMWMDSLLFLRI